MKIRPKIYVAGALNADAAGYIKNCYRMIRTADALRKLGYSVYVPCLDLVMGVVAGDMEYDDYFDNSQPWLAVSDALFLVPGYEDSKGTMREIDRSLDLGIPVFANIEKLKQALPVVEI